MRILIGLAEHMGDIVACEPVARYLRYNHPTAHLAWAVRPAFRELIDTNPFIDEAITLDCLTDWMRLRSHATFDKVVDLHVNYRVCPHCNIPLVKQHGNPFVTVYDWFDHGALLEAFALGAGLPRLSAQPRLYLGEEHAAAVDALRLPAAFCVVHRVSNESVKEWTEPGWRAVVSLARERLGLDVIEVGAGEPSALPQPLDGTIDMVNRLPLLQTAEVIRRARLFVGIDSGPAHFANAQKVPGVVLLGRLGYFRQYMPFNGFYASGSPLVKIVRHPTRKTRDLTIDEVTEAVGYVGAAAARAPVRPRPAPVAVPRWAPARAPRSGTLLASGLFDTGWIATHNPELGDSTTHPVDQYLSQPSLFAATPSEGFDAAHYPGAHAQAARAGSNPLLHHLTAAPAHTLPASPALPVTPADVAAAEKEFAALQRRNSLFAPAPAPLATEGNGLPRVFAFHLPQFHPIPENDWAHGPGFSEWHNVARGKPLFRGHYQPRIPGELGYYDLRAEDVLHEQVALAREHGISGFCFYYYYFQGRKLLYRPVDAFIKSGIDAPFMLLWANENWTKRWDGGNDEVIIAQHHSPEDDLAFLRGLVPIFADRRYVKVDGKPVLMIYKVHLFPDIRATAELWRTEIERHGFPGLYLVMVDDWVPNIEHPREFGFDAAYEIPSNRVPDEVLSDASDDLDLVDGFEGRIVDYPKFATYHLGRPAPNYRRFRTVMLPWDNTARYGARAMVHINGIGESYRLWLLQALLDTSRTAPPDERIVFLHSWNEWCEGTYLEPDGRYGRYFLEQTRLAIGIASQALGGGMTNAPEATLAELFKAQRAKDDGAAQAIRAVRMENHAIWRELAWRQSECDRLREEVGAQRALTEAFRTSTSWRVTQPLRALASRLRR